MCMYMYIHVINVYWLFQHRSVYTNNVPYLTEELISSQPTKPGNPRYLFRTTHLCKKNYKA